MPDYRITDPDTKRTITVTAKTPALAREMALGKLRPPATKDSSGRQKLEGFLQPIAGLADLIGGPRMRESDFEMAGLKMPPGLDQGSFQNLAGRISSAGEENPTPPYTFWRGIGRGATGIGMLSATGGLSAPLAGASLAGGLAGSEVETATGSGLAGAGSDILTSLVLGNPSGAVRLASKLKIGPGSIDDAVNAASGAFESARRSARSAFSRIPAKVEGAADVTVAREMAQRLMQINAPEDVPSFVRRIANWDVTVDFNTLRRAIASSSAARAAAGETTAAGRKAATGAKLNGALDDVLKQFEDVQNPASAAAKGLRDARSTWASFRDNFPSKGAFAHAVLNERTALEAPEDALRYIFNSKTRLADTQRLARAITGNPEAEQGMRSGYLQYLAGDPDVKSFGAVMQRFNKTRDVARLLFGDRASATLGRHLHRASSRGGDIANHPYILVMTLGGAGAVVGSTPGVIPKVVAAGTGAYWITRHLNAESARKVFVASAYDEGLRSILARRAARPESQEVISKVAAWAARNGVQLESAVSQSPEKEPR